MALQIRSDCIGCGGCEFACPTGAIVQGADFVVTYSINPLRCDDCGACVGFCPIGSIVEDPEWAICLGRGCPLSSRRYEGWACTKGDPPCPRCGGMLWHAPGSADPVCPECETAEGAARAACPKLRRARRLAAHVTS